jgi:polar amino acid transport system permease protein
LTKKRLKISTTDGLLAFLLLAAMAFAVYKATTGISYQWNWSAIPQYVLRYDAEGARWVPNVLLQGFLTTIRLSIWATAAATIFGTIMGMFRTSGRLFRRLIGGTYVELTRNLPPLVLVFIFYYFISDQILPLVGLEAFVRSRSAETRAVLSFLFAKPAQISNFFSAVIALSLFEGAYITEIVRGGIQSIERGQWEASDALGLNKWLRMRLVILPQATARILPPLAGQFISTIKDSAIVSIISIQELTFQGLELMSATYLTFEIWITISVLYLVLTLSCSLVVARIETAMQQRPGS